MIRKIKILYVEDDKRWQETIQEIVSMHGYQLDIASTSKEALFKLKRSTYHIALLDKRLDEDDAQNDAGLVIASAIADANEGTQIIVYTAYGTIDDARKAFRKIKVRDFVSKETPLLEVSKILRESADEALLEFKRPIRMPSEILVTKGSALEQFLSGFTSRTGLSTNQQVLDLFSRRLLGEFHPLLSDKSDTKLINLSQISVLQIRFWSKMLCGPIAAWFGKYNDMRAALEKLASDGEMRQSLGIGHKVTELFDNNIFPDFGGAVFELQKVDLDEFDAQMKFLS